MADTALDIITDSLLDLGVLADGETPSASQAQGGLRKLNNMLDAWNIENLMVYGSIQNVFALTAGVGVYTLGSGGAFNVNWPVNITSAYMRNTALPVTQTLDLPLWMYTDSEWQDEPLKQQTDTLPRGIYIDKTYPLQTVYLTPIPTTSQYSLVLWNNGMITTLALNDVFMFPPGYKRAITANLCIELAPGYEAQVSQATASIANSSKYDIRAFNLQMNTLMLEGYGYFDIQSRRYIQ